MKDCQENAGLTRQGVQGLSGTAERRTDKAGSARLSRESRTDKAGSAGLSRECRTVEAGSAGLSRHGVHARLSRQGVQD